MSEARLRLFVTLVERWSVKINLVSKRDIPTIWARHIEDSLALIPHIPPNTTSAIDLGSGAGFPGLVLAIETNIPFTLIESDTRKAAFLLEAARQTAAPVRVINARIETAHTMPAALITARALAPLEKLLGLALPHLAEDGFCLFPKGQTVAEELTSARRLWQMDATRLPAADSRSTILKVSNIRHVGAG